MAQKCSCNNRFADVDDLGPVDEIVEKYGQEKGALIPLLQEAQDAYGYLDEKIMRELAVRAGYQLSQLYGVATFFSQFRLKPVGEYLIKVCHGTACHVGGATQISDEVCNQLNIKERRRQESAVRRIRGHRVRVVRLSAVWRPGPHHGRR